MSGMAAPNAANGAGSVQPARRPIHIKNVQDFWLSIYSLFVSEREHGLKLRLHIPDTFLLRGGYITAWFRTTSEGCVSRMPGGKTTITNMQRRMLEMKAAGRTDGLLSVPYIAVARVAAVPQDVARVLRLEEATELMQVLQLEEQGTLDEHQMLDLKIRICRRIGVNNMPFCLQRFVTPFSDQRFVATYVPEPDPITPGALSSAGVTIEIATRQFSKKYTSAYGKDAPADVIKEGAPQMGVGEMGDGHRGGHEGKEDGGHEGREDRGTFEAGNGEMSPRAVGRAREDPGGTPDKGDEGSEAGSEDVTNGGSDADAKTSLEIKRAVNAIVDFLRHAHRVEVSSLVTEFVKACDGTMFMVAVHSAQWCEKGTKRVVSGSLFSSVPAVPPLVGHENGTGPVPSATNAAAPGPSWGLSADTWALQDQDAGPREVWSTPGSPSPRKSPSGGGHGMLPSSTSPHANASSRASQNQLPPPGSESLGPYRPQASPGDSPGSSGAATRRLMSGPYPAGTGGYGSSSQRPVSSGTQPRLFEGMGGDRIYGAVGGRRQGAAPAPSPPATPPPARASTTQPRPRQSQGGPAGAASWGRMMEGAVSGSQHYMGGEMQPSLPSHHRGGGASTLEQARETGFRPQSATVAQLPASALALYSKAPRHRSLVLHLVQELEAAKEEMQAKYDTAHNIEKVLQEAEDQERESLQTYVRTMRTLHDKIEELEAKLAELGGHTATVEKDNVVLRKELATLYGEKMQMETESRYWQEVARSLEQQLLAHRTNALSMDSHNMAELHELRKSHAALQQALVSKETLVTAMGAELIGARQQLGMRDVAGPTAATPPAKAGAAGSSPLVSGVSSGGLSPRRSILLSSGGATSPRAPSAAARVVTIPTAVKWELRPTSVMDLFKTEEETEAQLKLVHQKLMTSETLLMETFYHYAHLGRLIPAGKKPSMSASQWLSFVRDIGLISSNDGDVRQGRSGLTTSHPSLRDKNSASLAAGGANEHILEYCHFLEACLRLAAACYDPVHLAQDSHKLPRKLTPTVAGGKSFAKITTRLEEFLLRDVWPYANRRSLSHAQRKQLV
eukprot:jgi/Mesvir1/12384/Mv00560-RA.2